MALTNLVVHARCRVCRRGRAPARHRPFVRGSKDYLAGIKVPSYPIASAKGTPSAETVDAFDVDKAASASHNRQDIIMPCRLDLAEAMARQISLPPNNNASPKP